MVSQRSISSLCAVCRREPTGVEAGEGSDGLGVGVACSAQKVPNAAPLEGEKPEPPQQVGPVPLLSPTPCSLYSPSGSRAHFQPQGRGWAVNLLDFELHLVSSRQNTQPTPTFQGLHSSVAGLWGPVNYKKEFIVCSLGRP